MNQNRTTHKVQSCALISECLKSVQISIQNISSEWKGPQSWTAAVVGVGPYPPAAYGALCFSGVPKKGPGEKTKKRLLWRWWWVSRRSLSTRCPVPWMAASWQARKHKPRKHKPSWDVQVGRWSLYFWVAVVLDVVIASWVPSAQCFLRPNTSARIKPWHKQTRRLWVQFS